jgi:hypothetical protein
LELLLQRLKVFLVYCWCWLLHFRYQCIYTDEVVLRNCVSNSRIELVDPHGSFGFFSFSIFFADRLLLRKRAFIFICFLKSIWRSTNEKPRGTGQLGSRLNLFPRAGNGTLVFVSYYISMRKKNGWSVVLTSEQQQHLYSQNSFIKYWHYFESLCWFDFLYKKRFFLLPL